MFALSIENEPKVVFLTVEQSNLKSCRTVETSRGCQHLTTDKDKASSSGTGSPSARRGGNTSNG